jgi:NADH-quinone oxidoreductase subunit N
VILAASSGWTAYAPLSCGYVGEEQRKVCLHALQPHGPHIDFAGLSPLFALLGGATVVLMVGLFRSAFVRRHLVPVLTLGALGAAIGLTIWQFGDSKSLIAGALRLDDLTNVLVFVLSGAGIATVLLSWRARAPEEAAHGEYYALLLSSIAGMNVLVAAQNTITLFLGLELLSIPLYVLCATEARRAASLESGLKYLVIGSVGSATLLYGLAFLYGATGSTDFGGIAQALKGQSLLTDPLMLTGLALVTAGLAFKASVAPFHQWTPDVYEGAPTPVTAFMTVATKAAALGVALRLFDVALIDMQIDWGPALAALATITIVVGNVGALGQSSLKRLLAWSTVAQAGYMLAGILVSTRLGVQATVFYLAVYLFMNMAAFGVIVARERQTDLGDDIRALAGLGRSRPWLAWAMTIAMLSLAGIPATAGFIGKVYLIEAAVDGDYTWLGVVIVVGSMISLAYYLRVVATMWMGPPEPAAAPAVARPAMAGGSPEADDLPAPPMSAAAPPETARTQLEVAFVAVACGAATVFFGVVPGPLFDLVHHAGRALGGLF